MTTQEQNIAIAEACGWTEIQRGKEFTLHGTTPFNAAEMDEPQVMMPVPSYTTDLNAMHEAEKVLTPQQSVRYQVALDPVMTWVWTHATSAQRAEAFLRTIGKWKD